MKKPIPMTELERELWETIKANDGQAVQVDFLAAMHDVSGRTIRKLAKCLRENHGKPIGSRLSGDVGYYLITHPADREEQYQKERRRGISTLRLAAGIRGATLADELKSIQEELFGEGEAA